MLDKPRVFAPHGQICAIYPHVMTYIPVRDIILTATRGGCPAAADPRRPQAIGHATRGAATEAVRLREVKGRTNVTEFTARKDADPLAIFTTASRPTSEVRKPADD